MLLFCWKAKDENILSIFFLNLALRHLNISCPMKVLAVWNTLPGVIENTNGKMTFY